MLLRQSGAAIRLQSTKEHIMHRRSALEASKFMFRDRRIVVVMPAYNASKTLLRTYEEVLEQGIVDLIILVDDASLTKP